MPSRVSKAVPAEAEEVVELEHWEADDGASEEDDFDDELPAEADALVETSNDGYGEKRSSCPSPTRAARCPTCRR